MKRRVISYLLVMVAVLSTTTATPSTASTPFEDLTDGQTVSVTSKAVETSEMIAATTAVAATDVKTPETTAETAEATTVLTTETAATKTTAVTTAERTAFPITETTTATATAVGGTTAETSSVEPAGTTPFTTVATPGTLFTTAAITQATMVATPETSFTEAATTEAITAATPEIRGVETTAWTATAETETIETAPRSETTESATASTATAWTATAETETETAMTSETTESATASTATASTATAETETTETATTSETTESAIASTATAWTVTASTATAWTVTAETETTETAPTSETTESATASTATAWTVTAETETTETATTSETTESATASTATAWTATAETETTETATTSETTESATASTATASTATAETETTETATTSETTESATASTATAWTATAETETTETATTSETTESATASTATVTFEVTTTVESTPAETATSTETMEATTTTITTETETLTTSKINVPTGPTLTVKKLITLDERTAGDTILDIIQCSDENGTTIVDLELPARPADKPCSMCFAVEPYNEDWLLKYLHKKDSLDMTEVRQYYLNITCRNDRQEVTSEVIEVRLTRNSPPVFNPNVTFAYLTLPGTRDKKNGDLIYTVNTTDYDGDLIIYALKVTPDNGNFQIDPITGKITVKNDLSQECNPSVTFEVSASDRIHSIVLTILVIFQEHNQVPDIANLDEKIAVPESTAIGHVIYSLSVLHARNVTVRSNPWQALALFDIEGTTIRLKSSLDYEDVSQRLIRLTVYAKDEGGCASQEKSLIIHVTDVNERPTLTPQLTRIYAVEETEIDVKNPFRWFDPDEGDTHDYSIVAGDPDGQFQINIKNGAITSPTYDLDVLRRESIEISLTVMVKDSGCLTDNATLVIEIVDANDNAPTITNTPVTYRVSECDGAGTILGKLSATDVDSSRNGNNKVSFTGVLSSHLAVLASGLVILTSPMSLGQTDTVTVSASDQGRPTRTGLPASISAFAVPCSITTTTTAVLVTDTPSTTTDLLTTAVLIQGSNIGDNIFWIAPSCLLATCLLGLLAFMCWRVVVPSFKTARVSPLPKKVPEPVLERHIEDTPVIETFSPEAGVPVIEEPQVERGPPPRTTALVGDEDPKVFDFWKNDAL